MSDDTTQLTPRELVDVTNALAVSLRLLLLDKVWTREARLASVAATREPSRVGELQAVVEEMDILLHDCQDVALLLAAIGRRSETLLQNRFEALVETTTTAGGSGERMTQVFGRLLHHVNGRSKGSAALYLTQAADFLTSRVELEVGQIRIEYQRIAATDVSDGDMSEETQQAVGTVALGAGLLLGPEAAGAVVMVAAVIDCLT